MIDNQRHLFDIPDEVAYLNCAYTAPLLNAAREAGRQALAQKAAPWTITPPLFFSTLETVKERFSRLVTCDAGDVAVIPAVSYGISVAAANVAIGRGQRVVLLDAQFPSNVYPWRRAAREQDAAIITVERPPDSDWTRAVLAAIDDRTAVAALPHCHWTDGTCLDLSAIGRRCREVGAALVVDGTQSLGAMPFSVADIQPDFLVTTAHKWLLGPYSYGFCVVSPHFHQGRPLEENWLNRDGSEDFSGLVDYRDGYQPGARRFDVGEASNFILSPVAAAALEQLLTWGVPEIAATLKTRTDAVAERGRALGFEVAPDRVRAPHMVGLVKPGGIPPTLVSQLAEAKVYVSVRGNAIRISPHLYTTDADVDRLFELLERVSE